ncbi:MAG: hypothetical protein ACPL7I_06455, partial [Myxococcota bacterium]
SKFSLNFKLTTDIVELSDIAKKDKYSVEDNEVKLSGSKYNGFYGEFLKYAFIEFENPFVKGLRLVFGQHNVPWVGYEDHLSGMRWLGPVFSDKVKKLSSTDRGISLLYKFPADFGDMHISIVNGEGYNAPETTKDKDYMLRISVRPLPFIEYAKGLMLHGYYGYGRADIDGLNNEAEGVRKREILALSYDFEYLTILGQYLRTLDGKDTEGSSPIEGNGYGVWAKIKLASLLDSNDTGLFVRYEAFDPDDKKENDSTSRFIIAPYYYFVNGKVGMAIQYLNEKYEDSKLKDTNQILLNVIGKY